MALSRGMSISLKAVGVTLFGKRVFADVIKLKMLRWGDHLVFFRWAISLMTSGHL